MRIGAFGSALAVCFSGALLAQDCVTFSGPKVATLLNSSSVTGLVRQPDGSYTAVTGPLTQPFTFLQIQPNFQNYIGACTTAPTSTVQPSISLSAPPLGTASQVALFAPFGSSSSAVPGAAFMRTSTLQPQIRVGILKSGVGTVSQYSVPADAASISAADFNHDGILDLAVVYTGSGSTPGGVAILLGQSNATFKDAVSYEAAPNSLHATIADFNGDGNLDIAVAADTGSVTTLLGNGDGTFSAGASIVSSRRPASVIAADFDGDGILDLATANEDGTVSILPGNGDGTFLAPQNFLAGTDCVYLAAADFNNDGNLDLAVTNFDASDVAVVLGNGNGTFGPPALYISTHAPTGLVITDFNHDGKLDIVVGSGSPDVITPNFGSGEISVLLGNGDGTFQGGLYPLSSSPKSIAAGDLNGDGKPDLVTANPSSGSLSILQNNGDGTFQTVASYTPPPPSGGFSPTSVTVADLNGDGKMDLAVTNPANANVAVAIGNGDETFQTPTYYAVGNGPAMIATGDLNDDGLPDLVVANAGNVASLNGNDTGNVSILLGSGGGAFGAATNITAGSQPSFAVLKDLNGDGQLDLVVLNFGVTLGFIAPPNAGGVSVFVGKGNGTFQSAVNYAAGMNPTALAVGDLNGDGKPDLAAATMTSSTSPVIAVFLGNGDGTFGNPSYTPAQSGVTDLAITDLNLDGNPDLAVSSCCGDTQMSYLLGKGDGTFQPQVLFNGGPSPIFFAAADFNGDGKTDLAIADQSGNGYLAVLLNSSPFAPPGAFIVKSATAGQIEPFAPQSIVAAYGDNLATTIAIATPPLGTSLGGVTVTVTDSANAPRFASLFYVSPTQINFEIPGSTALGQPTVTIQQQNGPFQTATVQIGNVSPGLFELDTSGLVAAYVLPVISGVQQPLQLPLSPVDVTNQQIYLEMYGTGIRNAQNVTVTVGNDSVPVLFFGPAPLYDGLDQVNIGPLPSSLAGQGSVNIVLTADGQAANTVTVPIQ